MSTVAAGGVVLLATQSAPCQTNPGPNELERRFEAARAAKEAGDLAAAARASESVIALALREMGKLRLFEAAYPEAAEIYQRSVELEDVPDAHVDLAIAHFYNNRFEDALAETAKGLAADPRNPAAWTLQGEAQIKKKDYRAAAESLQRSLELRPDAETSYALASCYLRLKEKEKAEAIFRQMPAPGGNQATLHWLFALAYRNALLHDDAIREFQEVLVLNRGTPNIHYQIGLSYLMRNEWAPNEDARRELMKQLEADPRDFSANYLLGYMAFSANQTTEADRYLHIAARQNPTSAESWLYLGLNSYRAKDYTRAEPLLRKAILLAEKDKANRHDDIRKAYTSLGRMLVMRGQKAEGEKNLDQARKIQERIIADNLEGGGMKEERGSGVSSTEAPVLPQNDPAITAAPASKLDPSAPLNPRTLAQAKLTPEQTKAAAGQERYLRTVLGASYNDLATAEAIQEQYAAAVVHYQEAERWDARVPNLMRNLGLAAYRAGDRRESMRALKKALALDPSDQAAKGLLDELRATDLGATPQNQRDNHR